jgi:hypothetical protein
VATCALCPPGVRNPLLNKINPVLLRQLSRGNDRAAGKTLQKFVKTLERLIKTGQFPAREGGLLIDQAQDIIAALGPPA